MNTCVKSLLTENNICHGIVARSGDRESKLTADAVILATGGLSYPSTGSTGDGIRWAAGTGHRITECSPALVPFEIREEWVKDVQGLSLKNIGLVMKDGARIVRPMIIFVLILLLIKVLTNLL